MENLKQRLEAATLEGGNLAALWKEISTAPPSALKEVQEVYKLQWMPYYRDLMQDFSRGQLFVAQTQDFDSWLDCKDRWKDLAKVNGAGKAGEFLKGNFLRGIQLMIGLAEEDWDRSIEEFISKRIYAPTPTARDEIKKYNREDYARKWAQENMDKGWTWRKPQ